jgi:hypothetical protein
LIPHDEALLVAQIKNGTDVIRIGPDNTMGPIATLLSPDISRTVAQVDYAVAGSTGMAIIRRESGQYQAPYNVYTATFDPVTLSGGAIWAGTDPYATYRFITADGRAHVSGEAGGMFGSNHTQVAPGVWATLGQTAPMKIGSVIETHFSSPYLPGGIDSTNGASLRIYVPQPLQTEPNQGTIRSTILKVKEALVAEGAPPPVGSCGGWLATGDINGTEMTDVLLLKEIFEGQEKDRFGHGIFSSVPLRIAAFSAQNLISVFVGGRNPDMSAVGVPVYFAVTFNDYGAFFSPFDRDTGRELREGPYRGGTSQAQARILIHEMAHLLHVPGFQADALSRIAGASDDRLVEQNCGQLVGGIR